MTWIDTNGDIRPQSWEEYCDMVRLAPDWPSTQTLMQQYGDRALSPEPKFRSFAQRQTEPVKVARMRIRLFRADPHCFWCGTEVTLERNDIRTLATVDHLYSRWHPERKDRHLNNDTASVLHVLACYDCNQERAGAEMQRRPFVPKLKERLEFAQRTDATLALREKAGQTKILKPSKRRALCPEPVKEEEPDRPTMRVICTLEEAVEFSRENPAR